jgi:hypothetical protein
MAGTASRASNDTMVLTMGKPRKRVCLQDGPYLKLSELSRFGLIALGRKSGPKFLKWSHPRRGDIATGTISASFAPTHGLILVEVGDLSQEIVLVPHRPNFGGTAWLFRCPYTGSLASTLWKPPGAEKFGSRHAWVGQVAYLSQFANKLDRAHLGKARIATKLLQRPVSEAYEIPPRPRRMRADTYARELERFRKYTEALNF